jgi:hypothetical protein
VSLGESNSLSFIGEQLVPVIGERAWREDKDGNVERK